MARSSSLRQRHLLTPRKEQSVREGITLWHEPLSLQKVLSFLLPPEIVKVRIHILGTLSEEDSRWNTRIRPFCGMEGR